MGQVGWVCESVSSCSKIQILHSFTSLNLAQPRFKYLPKIRRHFVTQALCLILGPDFCTDVVIVETSDHARLQLQLSYNWHFEVGCSEC